MERRLAAVLAADMVGYSRLMEADEDDILGRQRAHRKDLIDPTIAAAGGNIVKATGDGVIVEFATAQDAVRCAIDIQTGMQFREASVREKDRIRYRVGINVGDIVFEDGDIFGDGVNVAARLEALAEPGGVCVSDPVYQMIEARLPGTFVDLGSQTVKNISRPIRVWQWTPEASGATPELPERAKSQQISFCFGSDGTQLAWAEVGSGPPVLKAPNWLNHLEYEWRSPIRGPFWAEMANHCRFVRFDQRGNGLSDWEPPEISEDAMIADMETVVAAAGLNRFVLFGISQGCAFSVRYAVEHPEQVAGLVLVGGYARGALKRNSPEQAALHEATTTLIREGWGSSNPVYRHLFTESMMPDASNDQKSSFDELQRVATSAENAVAINNMNAAVDITDLARQVKVPTLIMHSEGDRRVPVEEGRRLAALIPGARFVGLPGNNHALVGGSPAFDLFFEEFDEFLATVT